MGKTLAIIFVVGLAVIGCALLVARPTVSDYRLRYFNKEQPYVVGSVYYTKKGYLWAFTKSAYDRLARAAYADDRKTVAKMIDAEEVYPLRSGLKVRLLQREWGIARVRPEGETYDFWTSVEALAK